MSKQVTIDLEDLREIISLLHARYDDERFVPERATVNWLGSYR
jgi:hypothetical protein